MTDCEHNQQQLNAHLFDLSLTDSKSDWSSLVAMFVHSQLKTWPLAATNYKNLRKVTKRSLTFADFKIDIQHNPSRMRSTCANGSKEAIKERPCFLCVEHLADEQKGLLLLDKYLLLLNPYPIFNEHLTISSIYHVPQLIEERVGDMLHLADLLRGRTLFYNGAECGASAPDHFHFQSVPERAMPVDCELDVLIDKNGRTLVDEKNGRVVLVESYLRECVVIESERAEWVVAQFDKVISKLPLNDIVGEPMMNLLANFAYGKYRFVIFPRKVQRPSCFYASGDAKITISPASVEMGGVMITPRKEDFEKISKQDIINIFEEVSYSISI
jgi:hypothetical protein